MDEQNWIFFQENLAEPLGYIHHSRAQWAKISKTSFQLYRLSLFSVLLSSLYFLNKILKIKRPTKIHICCFILTTLLEMYVFTSSLPYFAYKEMRLGKLGSLSQVLKWKLQSRSSHLLGPFHFSASLPSLQLPASRSLCLRAFSCCWRN